MSRLLRTLGGVALAAAIISLVASPTQAAPTQDTAKGAEGRAHLPSRSDADGRQDPPAQAKSQRELQEEVERQQGVIDQQAKQIEEQKKILDDFAKRLEHLEKTRSIEPSAPSVTLVPAVAAAGTGQTTATDQTTRQSKAPDDSGQAAQNTPPRQLPGEVSGAAQRETFRRDAESVARVHNKQLDSAHKGFFNIPGTPARVKIDGYFKLDTIIDPRPAGNADQFNTTTIPISQPGQPQPATVNVHARQTRFNLDFRSPVGESEHDARVFFEFDFFGADGATDPRLRHAYGQYKNLLLGHTWSTFIDPDAFPDTLDFEMPAGVSDVRQAQARFTLPLSASHSLAFAIERPGTSAARTLFTNGKTYNPAPDGVIRWRYENQRGHLQVGSVLRALGYQDDTRNQIVFGYGLQVSTALRIFGDDSLQLYGSYGKGYARYIKNVSSYDVDLDNSGGNIQAMPAVGTYLGYTHHWTRPLRSTITFGFDRVQNTAAQPGMAFSKSYYTSGNLVWNPFGHLNVGAEFLHGWQVLKDGSQGNANRIQISIKYDLYRKEVEAPVNKVRLASEGVTLANQDIGNQGNELSETGGRRDNKDGSHGDVRRFQFSMIYKFNRPLQVTFGKETET